MEKDIGNYYDTADAIRAQAKYCWDHNKPLFAPRTGFCFNCDRDIYNIKGYTVGYASTHYITGCPYCHASFCE